MQAFQRLLSIISFWALGSILWSAYITFFHTLTVLAASLAGCTVGFVLAVSSSVIWPKVNILRLRPIPPTNEEMLHETGNE